jgi:hypothetical protein
MGVIQLPVSSGTKSQRQVFTTSGNFILPSGFGTNNPLWAKVTAVGGGGGGGSGYAAGGGGGGAVITRDVAISGNLPVVIGAGGAFAGESSNGARGGDTIVGNSPTRPVNLVRNPFQTNLFGGWDTTGWTNTVSGSISAFRSDYSTVTNQFLRNRHFGCADAPNFKGIFRSPYGISLVSTAGDSNYTFLSDFFDTDPSVLHYYGVYTRLGQVANTVTVTLEWYDSGNNLLGSGSPTTFNYATTADNKYSNSGTSPAGTAKARLRINMRLAALNNFSQIFGCYVSQEVDCAWQYVQNSGGYWTGAPYTSYLTRLNKVGLVDAVDLRENTAGFVAGGGGGGGRAADEATGGWLQARFGGPGGHRGGYGTGHQNNGDGNSIIYGGDGGGAGGAPTREVFRGNNATWPYSVTDNQGFVGNNSSGIWRTFGYRMPVNSHFQRPSSGNAGTSAFYLHSMDSANFARFRIEGAKPSVSGFSSGGPGCGFANFVNTEASSRYFYNEGITHYRDQPFGNGGAATNGQQNHNITNYGAIDYGWNGDWPISGDQGIVIFEYSA